MTRVFGTIDVRFFPTLASPALFRFPKIVARLCKVWYAR
jgi:hypothetical protein